MCCLSLGNCTVHVRCVKVDLVLCAFGWGYSSVVVCILSMLEAFSGIPSTRGIDCEVTEVSCSPSPLVSLLPWKNLHPGPCAYCLSIQCHQIWLPSTLYLRFYRTLTWVPCRQTYEKPNPKVLVISPHLELSVTETLCNRLLFKNKSSTKKKKSCC